MSDEDTNVGTTPNGTDGGWPVELVGVTESIVATLGPNGLWNVAALGLHAPDGGIEPGGRTPATAQTWGNTRTRRNFRRQGDGIVQFTTDPRTFVDAALTIREEDTPVLPSADAWVRVTAERTDSGTEGETSWTEWTLRPVESEIVAERPSTIDRATLAVVDATVAASRLDVDGYDTAALLDRLAYFAETVEKCGGSAAREAFERIDEATGWRERRR